jgi:hypothetical protein
MAFEANQGQAAPTVRFLAHGSDYTLYLTDKEAVLALRNLSDSIRIELVGASPSSHASGSETLGGRVNYLVGNDPSKWRRNISTYSRVRYGGVYPGVDLVYHGNQQRLEFDFVVARGADPRQVPLRFAGARRQAATARPRWQSERGSTTWSGGFA